MKAAGVCVAIAVALALQTTLARFTIGSGTAVDLVLIVVVFTGLTMGPVAGVLTGTVGGIAQDVLAGGVVGVAGLTKTIVGFLAGVTGSQFIVQHPLPRFVVFVAGSLVNGLCYVGLYALIGPRADSVAYGRLFSQAAGNGIVGILAFQLMESLPGTMQRRRGSTRGTLARRLD
jgi:rod shape-determining protein MreD